MSQRIERSASVDSPTSPKLEGEVSFGDNSPLFGVLPPSQRHALHLSLAAAAREASGEQQMPLNWDVVKRRIAEGVTEEDTLDELRAVLREFVKSKTQAPAPPTTPQLTPRQNRNPAVDMAENAPTVGQVLKAIEIFDSSNRGKVCVFIRSCKYAGEIIRPTDTEHLLKAVLSTRIKGIAAQALEYKSIRTWDALEEELKSMSIETRTLASLQVEFNSCRQRQNEDAKSYGTRLEQLTWQVIELTTREATEEDSKSTLERQVRKQAVNIFVRGLNDRLKVLVKSRRCEKLREAISIAIKEERDLGLVRGSDRDQHRSSCYNCGKPGHLARDCRSSRKSNTQDRQRLPTPSKYVRKTEVICYFYNKPGHFIRDCRKRLAEENRRGNGRNEGPPRGTERVQTGPFRDANRRGDETSGNEDRALRTDNRIASYQ
ncbi:uncharacterized protein LOC124410149 [Diprion similis]|uniref:uncharacterized protein LOC124410149 n=1 Tax=Diprion similis TaxID=362088 RepID=UPI001EF98942|nr:uncharacterized protein LOC124410149 [Diprion similis]